MFNAEIQDPDTEDQPKSHPAFIVPNARWERLPPRKTVAEVKNTKEPPWLIEGVLPHWPVGVMFGPSGSGKSFIALDWGLSIAAGVPWVGKSVTRGPVVYMVGEGGYGTGKRIEAWELGKPLPAAWEENFAVLDGTVNILNPQEVGLFIERERASGKLPVLVVVDTLARAMAGADEQATANMSLAAQHAKLIHDRLGSTVLIVHHTGWANTDRERGGSALPAAMDMRYGISGKLADSREVRLRAEKIKDGKDGWSVPLKLVDRGESLVVEKGVAGVEPKVCTKPREPDKYQLLIVGSLEGGPATFGELLKQTNMAKGTLSKRLRSLVTAGRVAHDGKLYQSVH